MPSVNNGGVCIAFEVYGTGRPVVLLHGFTLDSRMWSQPATQPSPLELLSQDFQVVCIDIRGHGKSDVPTTGYSRRERVPDILAVLDALKLPTVDLVGFSMGGSLALAMALDHANRLKTVTLVSTGAAGWSTGKKLDLLYQRASTEGIAATKAQWLEWSISYYQAKGRTDIVSAISTMIADHAGAQFTDPGRGKYPVVTPDLEGVHSITIPTLIQTGEDDRIFVPLARALHEKITGSTFSLYEGCGHLITMEEPVRWVDELRNFLHTHPDGQNVNNKRAVLAR